MTVLYHRRNFKMIRLCLTVNNDCFGFTALTASYRANTGSTAYNLAAGGPALHPEMPAMVNNHLPVYPASARWFRHQAPQSWWRFLRPEGLRDADRRRTGKHSTFSKVMKFDSKELKRYSPRCSAWRTAFTALRSKLDGRETNMLEHPFGSDFALIDTAEVDFTPGFAVFRETGAGKSLMVVIDSSFSRADSRLFAKAQGMLSQRSHLTSNNAAAVPA